MVHVIGIGKPYLQNPNFLQNTLADFAQNFINELLTPFIVIMHYYKFSSFNHIKKPNNEIKNKY